MKGKKVIVTGGAQGIGRAGAEIMAEAGADIGIIDINLERAEQTAKEIAETYGCKAKAYLCDVTSEEAVADTFAQFVADFGTLDGVFNNAGICIHKNAEQVSKAEWSKIIDVNLNGIFLIATEAARKFIKEGKKGSIVNTASMSGLIVNVPQRQASYNASKAAVTHLTKSLAVEWAEHGIRVNCISPGYIYTELVDKLDPGLRKTWMEMVPFHRMGTPDELAGGILYLMSDAATYTTGTNLVMDGGFTSI